MFSTLRLRRKPCTAREIRRRANFEVGVILSQKQNRKVLSAVADCVNGKLPLLLSIQCSQPCGFAASRAPHGKFAVGRISRLGLFYLKSRTARFCQQSQTASTANCRCFCRYNVLNLAASPQAVHRTGNSPSGEFRGWGYYTTLIFIRL